MKKNKEVEITGLHLEFWNYLKRVKQCNRYEILQHLRAMGITEDITDEEMRSLKQDLIDAGYLIGSSPDRGYFIIEQPIDLEEEVKEFRSKAKTLLRRSSKLKESYYKYQLEKAGKRVPEQPSLF